MEQDASPQVVRGRWVELTAREQHIEMSGDGAPRGRQELGVSNGLYDVQPMGRVHLGELGEKGPDVLPCAAAGHHDGRAITADHAVLGPEERDHDLQRGDRCVLDRPD